MEHKLKAEKLFFKNVTYNMVPILYNGNHTSHVQAFIIEGLQQGRRKQIQDILHDSYLIYFLFYYVHWL